MAIRAIVHISNQEPIVCDIDEMPEPKDIDLQPLLNLLIKYRQDMELALNNLAAELKEPIAAITGKNEEFVGMVDDLKGRFDLTDKITALVGGAPQGQPKVEKKVEEKAEEKIISNKRPFLNNQKV